MQPSHFVSDIYNSVLSLPIELDNDESRPIQLRIIYMSTVLLESKTFYILPPSADQAMNPVQIPREIFVRDDEDDVEDPRFNSSSKKGRPSKREKQKKAKDAIGALNTWLGKNTHVHQETVGDQPSDQQQTSTHVMISHAPIMTRDNYRHEKTCLLNSLGAFRSFEGSLEDTDGQRALRRANEAVLARLKAIDELAASQGMEVGGEGGEKTGLARVERAIGETGGMLGLLEGSGIS